MESEKKYRDLIPVIVERENATMPDWADTWGIKTVGYDLRTYGDYQWPAPGGTAECDEDRIVYENRGACPYHPGDGLCVAGDWEAMASGGNPAHVLLLVAYAQKDVLGKVTLWGSKCRVKRAYVAAIVDGVHLLIREGHDAWLERANLRNSNLFGADLARASLMESDMRCVDLTEATLRDANMRGVFLGSSIIEDADLRGTDLSGADAYMALIANSNANNANLTMANLRDANLMGSTFRGANLQYASLAHANLTGTDFIGADLTDANLCGANLSFASADESTILPNGYIVKDGYIRREEG